MRADSVQFILKRTLILFRIQRNIKCKVITEILTAIDVKGYTLDFFMNV